MEAFCALSLWLCVTLGCFAQAPILTLPAKDAGITGGAAYDAGGDFIGSWNDANAKLQWDVTVDEAAMTNLVRGNARKLEGGPTYSFPVKPQQIITMRLRTATPVAETKPLTDWTPLVPEHKRPALMRYLKDVKGHPPGELPW